MNIEEPSSKGPTQPSTPTGEDAPLAIACRAARQPDKVFLPSVTIQVIGKHAIAKLPIARVLFTLFDAPDQ